MMRNLLCLILLALFAVSAQGAGIPASIESCMKGNLPESTSAQSVELRTRDRSHYEQVLQADILWKRLDGNRSGVLMFFHEPVDVRGARFLILENQPVNDMFIYMPGLFKVRRITSRNISSSILGTDFSYEDFERLQGVLMDLSAEQLPDGMLEGRAVYVLLSDPGEDSGYSKIISYIDKESCVPLKTELYEHGDQLRKVMTVAPEALQHKGGIWVPAELLMKDLRDKTETRLIIQSINVGVDLDEELFDSAGLKQVKIPEFTQ